MYQILAGRHDRTNCPVWFEIPREGLKEHMAVRFEDGTQVSAQVQILQDRAQVSFVLEYLPAGEEAFFDLVEAEENPGAMQARVLDESVEIYQGDRFITRYFFGKKFAKPYMGPFYEKYGKQMTRLDFEIKEHPHHRSLWFSHGSVNGVDTWNEPEGMHGFILNQGIENVVCSNVYCQFTSKNQWTDFNKNPLCDDETTIRFYNTPAQAQVIDITLTLKASYGTVTLGKTKEAGPIAIRMNHELVVGKTGRFETPTGVNEEEIWMKRAPWCDYCGVAEGHSCGVTIMDNPENEGYPSYWHARNYGLMAPNNFYIPEERVMQKGESITWKYRVFFHNGNTQKADVAGHFADYIHMPLVVSRRDDDRQILWPKDPERAVIPFALPEDLTGWPEIPKWKKDMPAFMKWAKENGKVPKK